ncbi:MAG: macro domain-containing protein, partial [Gammaproteobacteria bacterium]|nr:macro domain-containing protein [Gammaproteobacteria bacterium]
QSCYRHCLELAREKGVRTIAFPAISTGVYGFPKAKAARIALTTMRAYKASFTEIIACCFSQEDAGIYYDTLTEIESQ